MTVREVLTNLESLGSEKVRSQNRKRGAGDSQFGVMMGDIRKLAAKLKTNHGLALELWETGNHEARLLAILISKVNAFSLEELDRMVRSLTWSQEADWFTSYVLTKHPDKEVLRQRWIDDPHPWAARAGWGLTSERIGKSPAGLDVSALLTRIEKEMGSAAPEVQWTMNFCLAGIGIHFPDLRARALAIGETLGLYRDYPVSKGCTSPFAPIWITTMVGRKEGTNL